MRNDEREWQRHERDRLPREFGQIGVSLRKRPKNGEGNTKRGNDHHHPFVLGKYDRIREDAYEQKAYIVAGNRVVSEIGKQKQEI